MNDRDSFLRAIAENPNDDGPRLMFADWLEERGEPERAELIRVQVELEPFRNRYGGRRATELRRRERRLRQGHAWLRDMPEGWDGPQTGLSLRFRRGFPEVLRGPASSFLQWGAPIRAQQPTIRRAVIHRLNGWGERLAACAALHGLPELELACWYADADLAALARSPHLRQLEVLVLWLPRPDVGSVTDLCRLAAGAEAWPNLRELVLFDAYGMHTQESEPLMASANRWAGRQVARYECGDSERLPFEGMPGPCFALAGWLPDDRGAVAEMDVDVYDDPDLIPTALAVRAFNVQGPPREEVIRVPLPPELANEAWTVATDDDGRYTQHLRDTIGFEPGLVRVPRNALGERLSLDGYFEDWGNCGYPDPPDADEARGVNGNGAVIYWYLRAEDFVVGHVPQADSNAANTHQPETPVPPPNRNPASEDELPF